MPNAIHRKILLIGGPGSGKTTQLRTLPGKKFCYFFDPNAFASLDGIEYESETFLPQFDDLDLSVKTLSGMSKGEKHDSPKGVREPLVYTDWQDDLEQRVKDKYFEGIDVLMLDSATMFLAAIMDRVQFLNGRLGKHPEQDDYTAQMANAMTAMRILTGLPCPTLLVTAHHKYQQDRVSKQLRNEPMLTGELKVKFPLLFTDIFVTRCESDQHEEKFVIQTRPDRENPYIRTSIRGLDFTEDVAIESWDDPLSYGIGKIIKEAGK